MTQELKTRLETFINDICKMNSRHKVQLDKNPLSFMAFMDNITNEFEWDVEREKNPNEAANEMMDLIIEIGLKYKYDFKLFASRLKK